MDMAENKTLKNKTIKRSVTAIIVKSIIFVLLCVAFVMLAIFRERTIEPLGVYRTSFNNAYMESKEILQDRYAIMAIKAFCEGKELKNDHFKYGIIEKDGEFNSWEELSYIDDYIVDRFDGEFDVDFVLDKCDIFYVPVWNNGPRIEDYISYKMDDIFGYASIYGTYYSTQSEPDSYIVVVSYVEDIEHTKDGIITVGQGFDSLWDQDLFVQLYAWLELGYFIRHILVVAIVALGIAVVVLAVSIFIDILKIISRALKKLKYVQRTIVVLVILTLIGAVVVGIGSEILDIDMRVMMFLYILACLVLVWPVVLYISYQVRILSEACKGLAEGDMSVQIDDRYMCGVFKEQAEHVNSIRDSINIAVDEMMKSERLKTELITNVSHDIKTPLTSIINYVDLLGKEEFKNEKAREYLEVLNRQALRLKKLIIDLIEASKAATGNVELEMMKCDAGLILNQVVGEYQEKLDAKGLSLVVRTPEESATIMADSKSLFRIFDNLLVNIEKYSLENTRAYVDLEMVDDKAVFVFRNTSKEQLPADGNLFMERFYQGDISRNAEGNGLGLSVAKSLTELMGGDIQVMTDGDLFKVTISFDIFHEEPSF